MTPITETKKTTDSPPASALAGAPIWVPRTNKLDIVLEAPLRDPEVLLPHLTGYKKPGEHTTMKALQGPTSTKVGTVLGGARACEVILDARKVGGEVSLRMSDPSVELGKVMEPDMRLTSLTIMGSSRFTDEDGWLVCEMAAVEETPEEMAARINAKAFRIVNLIQHVPLAVSAAIADLLRTRSFDSLWIREPVARK